MADTTRATLPLDRIKVDPTIQIRRSNHEQTIERYMAAFERLPPVDVFDTSLADDGDEHLLLADGFHRIASAIRLGREDIEAHVHRGTREDALEFAVIANTRNADPLTPEERDAGIRRLRQIHPDWSNVKVADAMSVSEGAVRNVFRIDEIKRETFVKNSYAYEPSDTHYREIARAPKEQWQPLVDAAQERNWSHDETALAVKNLKDVRIPVERKEAILQGEADPVIVTEDGQFAVPTSVVGRQMRAMETNDAVLALERALEQLAKLRLFRPEVIVETAGGPRIDRLIAELPGYVQFLEELLAVAKRDRGKVSVVK